jgi:DNA-binding MarR family transcriptional regulator
MGNGDDAAAERWRLREALQSLQRITSSRHLDLLHAARTGVPIGLSALGVLGRVIDKGPLRMSELAAAGRMHPAALTRHVQALEEEGMIERSPDPTDRRASVVRATTKGRAAHRRMEEVNDEIMAAQLADWSVGELEDLNAHLDRLIVALRRPTAPTEAG